MAEQDKAENTGKKIPDVKESTSIATLTKEAPTKSNQIEVPKIELPKGGGAIRSIGEKFQVNAANGTASLNLPLPITPGRHGFTPSLNLNYNSGGGNSAFGLGWSLDIPHITRKTDKGIPTYRDEDVFILSGAEDLVPYLVENGPGNWVLDTQTSGDYSITRYRSRVTSDHSRIELISHPSRGMYWRIMGADNVTTVYGRTPESRISDPADDDRIFRWLPEFRFDDKGNRIRYQYESENLDQVPNSPQEKNRRNGVQQFSNRYLKRVRYGNAVAYRPDAAALFDPSDPVDDTNYFEVVFDYGDHDADRPQTLPEPGQNWALREDPFSSYRSGFEIRTYRLCQRVLMFHHFPDETNHDGTVFGNDYLVRSLGLEYTDSSINNSGQAEVNYLTRATVRGYVRKADGSYFRKSMPSMQMEYQQLHWNHEVQQVSRSDIDNLPTGLTGNYQWVDLFGEGISGLLTEQGQGWYYKDNLGYDEDGSGVRFGESLPVASKPSFSGLNAGTVAVADLDADGLKEIVARYDGVQGYFGMAANGGWQSFQPFSEAVNLDVSDPNVRVFDITGDGRPDLVMTDERVICYYQSKGRVGYAEHTDVLKALDEERGPALVFADQEDAVMLADMSGDGLTDIVRVRNGEISYWPNMGHGHFGARVAMGNVPYFDQPGHFNPRHLHLADVSGTGTSDVIYKGNGSFQVYLNLSGNSLSDVHLIEFFAAVDDRVGLQVVDLHGTGTSCLVWSSTLSTDQEHPLRFMDLMSGKKPHLLKAYGNSMGMRTTLEYRSSTQFYLQDKLIGRAWITKLPFPVQVVERSTVEDLVSNVRFSSRYSYHHGFYDHQEREFRGFGLVEQMDSEYYSVWHDENNDSQLEQSEDTYQPPVLTRTWFHTGAFLRKDLVLNHFKNEYWAAEYEKAFPGELGVLNEPDLPDAVTEASPLIQDAAILDSLSAQEQREAVRACKGMVLRREIFSLDADPVKPTVEEQKKQLTPFNVEAHNCRVILQQPLHSNPHACFQVLESEAVTLGYERDIEDPRISHKINLQVDQYGNVLESASIAYPRATPDLTLAREVRDKQALIRIVYNRNRYTNDVIGPDSYRLRVVWEEETFELTDIPRSGAFYTQVDLSDALGGATVEIPYQQAVTPGSPQRRKIEHTRHLFYSSDLVNPLAPGMLDSKGIPYESYLLAYSPAILTDLFGSRLPDPQFPATGGLYVQLAGGADWWLPSGIKVYRSGLETLTHAANRFFVPIAYRDPSGAEVEIGYYKNYYFLIESSRDVLSNTIRIESFNFRTLSATLLRDVNDTLSGSVLDELGMVKAIALLGKDLDGDGTPELQLADTLTGINEWSDDETASVDFYFQQSNAAAINTAARGLLKEATTRYVYDLHAFANAGKPAATSIIQREQHHASLQPAEQSPLQITFEYTNGPGELAMTKRMVEPGMAKQVTVQADGSYNINMVDTSPAIRWLGNGRTVFNNKGNIVKQYEPYFSVTPAYEDLPELVDHGVTSILYYDSLSRHYKTVSPDQTFVEVRFDAWKQEVYDQNDSVQDSDWYANRINRLIDAELTAAGKDPAKEENAAAKAGLHHNTPSTIFFDVLGRPVMTQAHNKRPDNSDEFLQTTIDTDIEGNTLSVTDARGNIVVTYRYDMLGRRVYTRSMDAGQRWQFANVLGKTIRSWDERNHTFVFQYDALHREIQRQALGGDGPAPLNHTFEKIVYGEGMPNDREFNLRGKVWNHYDTAGKLELEIYDQRGNPTRQSRKFAQSHKQVPDWGVGNPDATLQNGAGRVKTTAYDALGRVVQCVEPDGSTVVNRYNQAGLLNEIDVTRNNTTTPYVKNIDYNEKGQRQSISYGNNVITRYHYDADTFRLLNIQSRRANNDLLQDLLYTYDAVGNITETEDRAIPTKFFTNQVVEPRNRYTYDALYRLVEAQGKEHIAQVNHNACDNWNDLPFLNKHQPGDDMAWRNYTQSYSYDTVGNILQMRHVAAGGNWTRNYSYENTTNRLTQTQVGTSVYNYSYHHQHGFLTALANLQAMDWNFRDELSSTVSQSICTGATAETTYYVYNAMGRRMRKITENPSVGGNPPTMKEERQYIDDVEVYTRLSGANAGLERTTLHIRDDRGRIAMIEVRNNVNDGTDPETIRYQLGNRSDNVHLELDHQGEVISYEEYHPYGTTAYQASNASVKAAAKRYRYIGMERDEESGLSYHNARYYLCWLGRWLKPDPEGLVDGLNLYRYSRNNPIRHKDPSGTQPPMSEEQKSAWANAEKNRYDGDSVEHLISVIERERDEANRDNFTRQSALEYATVRASAAVINWEDGNYLTSIAHGTFGIIESFGYTILGDSNTDTAKNAAVEVATAGIGNKIGRVINKSKTSNVSVSVGKVNDQPGMGTMDKAIGHNAVGTKVGDAPTQWTDLVTPGNNKASVRKLGDGKKPTPENSKIVDVPVTESQARLAQKKAQQSVGEAGEYSLLNNDCATHACGVLNTAGVPTLPYGSPGSHYATTKAYTALTSEGLTSTLMSTSAVITTGSVLNSSEPEPNYSEDPNASSSEEPNYSEESPVCEPEEGYYDDEAQVCYMQ